MIVAIQSSVLQAVVDSTTQEFFITMSDTGRAPLVHMGLQYQTASFSIQSIDTQELAEPYFRKHHVCSNSNSGLLHTENSVSFSMDKCVYLLIEGDIYNQFHNQTESKCKTGFPHMDLPYFINQSIYSYSVIGISLYK